MAFQPGRSGNPSGRPVLPPEIRAERKKNQGAFVLLVAELFALTPAELKARWKKKPKTQLEACVQGIITKGKQGSVEAVKFLMAIVAGELPKSDYDGFTEEDLRILNRVKEVFEEQKRIQSPTPSQAMGTGNHHSN